MRLDDMFIAGTGVYLPGLVSAEEGVRRGWYGAAEAAESGWTSAAGRPVAASTQQDSSMPPSMPLQLCLISTAGASPPMVRR